MLSKAIENGNFTSYTAYDLSETSTKLCNEYLTYLGFQDSCIVDCRNFFDIQTEQKFDCIVMGEVLEHVQNPRLMLERIYELLKENGKAFITTVINAPAIDHIFLFRNKDRVLEMAENVGFNVEDYMCATAGDIPIKKAEKKKMAIDIAMVLTKTGKENE